MVASSASVGARCSRPMTSARTVLWPTKVPKLMPMGVSPTAVSRVSTGYQERPSGPPMAVVTMCLPREAYISTTPLSARLMPSVEPEVNSTLAMVSGPMSARSGPGFAMAARTAAASMADYRAGYLSGREKSISCQ